MMKAHSAFGQKMILETDKSSYEYGETIEIHVSIINDTDSTITFVTSYSGTGGTAIGINDLRFPTTWLPMVEEIKYSPGQQRIYIWKLKPEELGVPDRDGIQIMYGSFNGYFNSIDGDRFFEADSLIIEAPKYRGGLIHVRFEPETEESERQAIRDSLGAEVLVAYDDFQEWQIEGHSIDSIASAYKNDPRIRFIYPNRELSFPEQVKVVTGVNNEVTVPWEVILHQNYPNPFNPVTMISYELQKAADVRIEIIDIQGRLVETLVNQSHQSGHHMVNWDASGIVSGTYLYRLTAGNIVETKKMLLIK